MECKVIALILEVIRHCHAHISEPQRDIRLSVTEYFCGEMVYIQVHEETYTTAVTYMFSHFQGATSETKRSNCVAQISYRLSLRFS